MRKPLCIQCYCRNQFDILMSKDYFVEFSNMNKEKSESAATTPDISMNNRYSRNDVDLTTYTDHADVDTSSFVRNVTNKLLKVPNENPAFASDIFNSRSLVSDTLKTPETSLRKTSRSSSINTIDENKFDDGYTDDSGVSLIYSHHEKVPFKNFSKEVRAAVDVRHFLDNTYLLLSVQETNADLIVQALLSKMLHDVGDVTVVEQTKMALFTHDKMHQLSRTIQGTNAFPEGHVDYDQNWICAMCAVPTVNEVRVGIASLSSTTNMGRNCQDCRLVVLILTPNKVKGTKNQFERARTFGTMFADLSFRYRLLDANSEIGFKDLVHREALRLSAKHAIVSCANVEFTQTSFRFGFMKGIVSDINRRLPVYTSDYTDAFKDRKSIWKSLSCTVFLYFACLLPSIAFGVLNEENTNGELNVLKVIYSQTFGGLFFSVFGGTPHIVLLTTAPLAIYSKIIYSISSDFGIKFPAMYACVGLWNAFFLILYSVFDVSAIMRFSTRSSEETFALFISIAFAVDAFKNLASNFATHYNIPQCDRHYNQTAVVNTLLKANASAGSEQVPEMCDRENSLLYLLLLLGTTWVAVTLYNFTRTPYLTAGKREILADYALPISVVVMTIVGSFAFGDVEMGRSFDHNSQGASIFKLADLSSLTIGNVFGAMGLGFCLSLLFFMDQNITASLVNAPQNKMQKGTSYHWDLLVISAVNIVTTLLTFPMVHAALPHSPLHVRALADTEERVVQGHIQKTVVFVRETRIPAILSHVLIGFSIFITFILAYIPMPVLYGLFLYVAITALYDNQFFERITLFFTEQSAYPPSHYVRHVPQRTMHLFSFLQLVQLFLLCAFGFVGITYLKMFFPVLIFLLIPIRHKIIPKIIDQKYIDAIDHGH